MTLNERKTGKFLDQVDQGTYERIYEILEQETFTPLVDAWKNVRRINAVNFRPVSQPKIQRQPNWTDEQYKYIQDASNAPAFDHYILTIGDDKKASCVVTNDVRIKLLQAMGD